MRTPKHSVFGALLATVMISTVACGSAGSAANDSGRGDAYKVGVILPLTGAGAAVGHAYEQAINVFGEISPDVQGFEVEYIVCDDKSVPDGAATCARQLKQQDKVDVVFGPVLATSHAGATPILASGPPSVTVSPYVTPDPKTPIFSVAGSALDLDQTVLRYAEERGFNRIAVLASTDITGERAVRNVQESGGGMNMAVSIERFGPTDTDATAQLNRLLGSDPQYLYIAATGNSALVALKGLDLLNADLPTALIPSNTTPDFIAAAKSSFPTETLYPLPLSWLPDKVEDPERAALIRKFKEAFAQRAGRPISYAEQVVYDGFEVIVLALKAGGHDADAIADHIEGLNGFQSLDWTISFSPDVHTITTTGNFTMMRYNAADDNWVLARQAS